MTRNALRRDGRFGVGRLIGLAFLLGPLLAARDVHAREPPFVAAFDRFGRHAELEPALAGRLLLTELNCTACHATQNERLQPRGGPRLDGVGVRLGRDWLRQFLASPHAVKPGTTMPEVIGGLPPAKRDRAVAALVAFLSTRREPFREFEASGANPLPHEFWRKGNVDRGRRLYHRVGCVACHEPDDAADGLARPSALDNLLAQLDPEDIEELGLTAAARAVRSVPHANLAAKYTRQSLTSFLVDPASIRPSARMPDLKLSPIEAAEIAAYLLAGAADDPATPEAAVERELIAEGRRLFTDLRCANCHALDAILPLPARPLADLNPAAETNCLDAPAAAIPVYGLDAAQQRAIRAALDECKRPDSPALAAAELVKFRMLQANCFACHERGRLGGVGRKRQAYFEAAGHVDLGDEGRLPPPLEGVGARLRANWLAKVLAGEGDVRPHMLARMPRYTGDVTAALPAAFAEADARTPADASDAPADPNQLVDAGRMLLDTGCVQCHPVRGESLPGVVGIDLAGVPGRVHEAWFRGFLLDPGALKPRTRMPTFFPKGRSANPDVLDGNVDLQIAAVWAYLKEVDRQPLPEKIAQARSQAFELVPGERPIVLRTFMKEAGTHAIAAGFPQKVHFAFDANSMRLAQAWRGRFLDAYGTWFVRFAPPADPLGDDIVSLPEGVPLAKLASERDPWPAPALDAAGYRFRGYRLDREGVPTFLYAFDGFDVEDRIEPYGKNGLKRRILIRSQSAKGGGVSSKANGPAIWFRAHLGKSLRQAREVCTDDRGVKVAVPQVVGRRSLLRESDGRQEWLLPVVVGQPLELEYRW
ncbi:MAG: c-type cytochrome [Planctomycetes bacterium]|nr:c-type cytochrome [Planctomycetota bacterium]